MINFVVVTHCPVIIVVVFQQVTAAPNTSATEKGKDASSNDVPNPKDNSISVATR